MLTDNAARAEVDVPVSLLERTISAVDPDRWVAHPTFDLPSSTHSTSAVRAARVAQLADPWLYFYEDFLAVYDPKLRKNRGVYFTPAQVVSAQVALIGELLEEKFDKQIGLVDDDVVVLDPACGTGTYLLAALRSGLELVRTRYGDGAVASRATTAAKNFHGFEILVGPYAVSHLRVAQQVLAAKGSLPADGVHVYLTDTLDSPHAEPMGQLTMTLANRRLAEEHERARRVKADTRVLVCLGNPPYYRQQIEPGDSGVEREGGWVRFGEEGSGGILSDFVDPATATGQGQHVKNLYNLYVYFWRWAIWKVLDSTDGPGIVSFITASSYLRGPGFVGMRRKMREVFDELWIIDLGGEGRGARRSDNVFAIQTPVAIAVGVRYGAPNPETPATTHYARIEGTEAEKLSALAGIDGFESLTFEPCFADWEDPLLPESTAAFGLWPALTDLFPWQHSGAQFKRTWPIAPSPESLRDRWKIFVSSPISNRAALLHETRDRKVSRSYLALPPSEETLSPLVSLDADNEECPVVPYGYRSFDRQYAIADGRLGDFLRPSLWSAHGPDQLYMTTLLTGLIGDGPAATVTALIPDLHHFRGSFGAKDAIPLFLNHEATTPNVTAGLLEALSAQYGRTVEAGDLFSYCYSVLASPRYMDLFSDELEIPGPRIPLTSDRQKFDELAELGRGLIHLHTYGQRFGSSDEVHSGSARCVKAVPTSSDAYPENYSYKAESQTLFVGDGKFAPVAPEVFEFSVSGLVVVKSWLDYRMKNGRGQRTSSDLDKLRPTEWPAHFTEELLRLLWILEGTIATYPQLFEALDSVLEGPMIEASVLPKPSDDERRPPGREAPDQDSFDV